MRESVFHAEWIDSWRHFFTCHIFKIPDMPRSSEARFIPQKPYDILCLCDRITYAMELKLMTKIAGFPFKSVSEWQVKSLHEAEGNGAEGLIVINYRQNVIPEKKAKRLGIPTKLNEVFCLKVSTFVRLYKEISNKSISFEEMREYADYRVTRAGDFWNIPSIAGV